MAYIALQRVRFDRDYLVGESIPGEVVSPERAEALKQMKLIAEIATQEAAGAAEGGEDVNTRGTSQETAENAAESAAGAKKQKAKK